MTTWNPWAMWCLVIASLGSPCAAQHPEDWGGTRMEQEIWKFLAEAIESTKCSEKGAKAIQTHLELHGLPWSVEAAWLIEGLTVEEQRWLIDSATWRDWVDRRVTSKRGDPLPSSVSVTREIRFDAQRRNSIHELQSRVGAVRMRLRLRHLDSLQMGGCWSQTKRGWHWVVGNHGVSWGHGLTVPRADMFGLSLFLGDAELRLYNPPRGLIHSEFEGGLRGVVLERETRRMKVGVTLGKGHLGALALGTFRRQEWGWTLFKEGHGVSFGPHWTARFGAVNMQGAGAFSNDGTTALRASWRLARSRSWVTQSALDVERHGRDWTAVYRGYATWLNPQTGKGMQVRWRRRGPRDWDVRAKGIPDNAAFVNWSFFGDGHSTMVGIHASTKELRCTWWLGRSTTGSWSQARHVECVWRMNGGWSAGFVGMDGRGDLSDGFVMVPALDARRWSRLPNQGHRMGMWCAKRRDEHSWTAQWTWSPSQQETFRCALRWRWDA